MDTKSNVTNAAGVTAGSSATPSTDGADHKPHGFSIRELGISKCSLNYGHIPDEQEVAERTNFLQAHGLPAQIILVRNSKGGFNVLVGSEWLTSLKLLRGEDGELRPDEVILLDLQDEDPQCLDYLKKERALTHQLSIREWADFVARLIDELEVDDGRLAELLGMDRAAINRLKKLHLHFSVLPANWQKDLNKAPSFLGEAPRITLSHWMVVAAQVQDGEITDELVKLLDDAFKKELSTRALREAVKALVNPANPAGQKKAGAKPGKSNPVTVGNQVLNKIYDAGAVLLKASDLFPDIRGRLDELYSELRARLEAMAVADAVSQIGRKASKISTPETKAA